MNLPECPDLSPRYCEKSALVDWLPIYRSIIELDRHSIYDLPSPSPELLGQIEDEEIRTIADIPLTAKLSKSQLKLVNLLRDNRRMVQVDHIKKFMESLVFPMYFFDYETCMAPLPPFDGMRPYQQIPCQYSLHILAAEGSLLEHHEYLHTQNCDPTPGLVQQLLHDIGGHGSVVVWNATFEKTRNKELAAAFPMDADFLLGLNDRLVDLILPLSKDHFVDPAFMGSASIKKVLPVLVPELSYKELTVQDGLAAQRLWMAAVLDGKGTVEEREGLFKALCKYCELDTLATVRIYEVLVDMVSRGQANASSA